jgi:XTP/dITP diphosphohydrolase
MSALNRVLVLGTHNRKKGRELAELLAPYGLELRTLADVCEPLEVAEDGESFAANARLKAVQQARHLRCWVLGEDSGLCVDALHGRPGVYSARYAGAAATDEANIAKLLQELQGVPWEQRTGCYISHLVLADPVGTVRAEAHGSCRGRIALERRGTAGFGYDPVFEIIEFHRTFGELGAEVKGLLSHRGRAIRQLLPQVARLVAREPASFATPRE